MDIVACLGELTQEGALTSLTLVSPILQSRDLRVEIDVTD